jgi:hypothetical protein
MIGPLIELVSIDPGNEGGLGVCACAAFERRKLVALWFQSYSGPLIGTTWGDTQYPHGLYPGLFDAALEVPMIYPQGHERPNDLIKLGIAGALLAASLGPRELTQYTPAEWKGQKAKPACHLILWEKLTPEERALFPEDTEMRIMRGVEVNAPRMYKQPLRNYSFKAHNLLDACAIGFHHMGR